MEVTKQQTSKHTLSLDNRQRLTLTGVKKVKSISETMLVTDLGGSGIVVNGSNLQMIRLDVDQGIVELEGSIDIIKYTGAKDKQNLLKKVFG